MAQSGTSAFAEFVEYPPPFPSELEDVVAGSWAYFQRVTGENPEHPTSSSSSSPPGRYPPRRVGVRFHVHDIKDINEVAGTVQVDFSALLTWTDPVVAAAAWQAEVAAKSALAPSCPSSSPSSSSSSAAPAPVSPSSPTPRSRPQLRRASSTFAVAAPAAAGGEGGGGAGGGGGASSGSHPFFLTTADLQQLWQPDVTVENAPDASEGGGSSGFVHIRDASSGRMESRLRYRGLINNKMDLRCFPFDADLLLLTLRTAFSVAEVVLVPDPVFNAADTHVRHSLSEWELDPPPQVVGGTSGAAGDRIVDTSTATSGSGSGSSGKPSSSSAAGGVVEGDGIKLRSSSSPSKASSSPSPSASPAQQKQSSSSSDADTFSTIHLVLKVHRNPFFYLSKMVAIQEMVAIWSWTVFYHDPEDIAGRMSTTLTLFLSSVAFLHVINDRLPRMPYLTVLDKFTYTAFFLLFLTAYENLFSYYASHHMGDRELAVSIDLFARFAFPAMHVAALIVLGVQIKNSRRTELELGNEL